MASCPSQAVFAKGLTYEDDFYPLPERILDPEAFKGLLETRRSVRVFKDEPVPREKLEKIVSLIAMAPMGVPLHKVEITVVDRRETIDKALPYIVAFCRKMERGASNPITRFIMRRQMSLERFNVVNGFLRPLIKELLPHMKQTGRDIITWNAPAMFLFHADKGAECHTENIFIDLAYGLLAAHSMGLGATPIGVVPPAVEMTPALRRLFDIPKGHEVLSSMILGYPKRPFRRAIKREMADVRRIGTKHCTGAMLL
jgi:nitroreductase